MDFCKWFGMLWTILGAIMLTCLWGRHTHKTKLMTDLIRNKKKPLHIIHQFDRPPRLCGLDVTHFGPHLATINLGHLPPFYQKCFTLPYVLLRQSTQRGRAIVSSEWWFHAGARWRLVKNDIWKSFWLKGSMTQGIVPIATICRIRVGWR